MNMDTGGILETEGGEDKTDTPVLRGVGWKEIPGGRGGEDTGEKGREQAQRAPPAEELEGSGLRNRR